MGDRQSLPRSGSGRIRAEQSSSDLEVRPQMLLGLIQPTQTLQHHADRIVGGRQLGARLAARRIGRYQSPVDLQGGQELVERPFKIALRLEQRAEIAMRVGQLLPPFQVVGVQGDELL